MKIIDDVLKKGKAGTSPAIPAVEVNNQPQPTTTPESIQPQPTAEADTPPQAPPVATQQADVNPAPIAPTSVPTLAEEPNIKPMEEVTSFRDLIGRLENDGKERTQEDIKKDEKRERRRALMAAIGDGVGSLANLYFTSKGAQSIDMPSLSKANNERHQKMMDERKANQEKYKNMYMNAFGNDMRLTEQRRAMKQAEDNRLRAEDKEERRYNQSTEYRTTRDKKQDERDDRNFNYNSRQYEDSKLFQDKRFNHQLSQEAKYEANALSNAKTSEDKNTFSIAYIDPVDKKTERVLHINKKNEGAIVSLYSDLVIEARKKNANDPIPPVANLMLSMGEGGDHKGKMLSIIMGRSKEFPELTKRLFKLAEQPFPYTEEEDPNSHFGVMRHVNTEPENNVDINALKSK